MMSYVAQAAGRSSEAAEATLLADKVRRRAPADADSSPLFANILGILSDMGRIDEAAALGRQALYERIRSALSSGR